MYDGSIWSSKILIPLWVVQISLQFVSIVSLSALLADETGTFNIVPSFVPPRKRVTQDCLLTAYQLRCGIPGFPHHHTYYRPSRNALPIAGLPRTLAISLLSDAQSGLCYGIRGE